MEVSEQRNLRDEVEIRNEGWREKCESKRLEWWRRVTRRCSNNVVGSNEWREPEGFVGEKRKEDGGTVRHSTRT